MERQIGETFQYTDTTLQVVEQHHYRPCENCAFDLQCNIERDIDLLGSCDKEIRADHKHVIFKEIEEKINNEK